jgi:hypothetical protein
MQFLKTEDKRIINEEGTQVILKGYGAGNWMVQEAFLFGTGGFSGDFKPFFRASGMDRTRTISQILTETCGSAYAESFWPRFYRSYLNENDIRHLHEAGFNSIRLPLNARAFLKEEPEIIFNEETFTMLDELLDACEKHDVYAILDLHAAYAGQSTVGCDDGVDNQPHLFTDAEGRERTVLLWKTLAERYSSRACVAGYELLNEPLALPFSDPLIPELLSFYDEVIGTIRSIDTKHIIFLQGNRFAKVSDLFVKDMDPVCHNWVLTYHIYENLPDLRLLGYMLQERERLNVPVWVGETGGSAHWTTVLYEMLCEYGIGFNVWCHKAVDRPAAPTLLSYELPEGFEKIRDYALQGKGKPSFAESMRIFDAYIENVRFENCTVHEDQADAILRTPSVSVPAIGFDVLPGREKSYSGTYPYAAYCGYRLEAGMHMVLDDAKRPYETDFRQIAFEKVPKYGDYNRLVLQLEEGEFACYTIRSVKEKTDVSLCLRALTDGEIAVQCGQEEKKTVLSASDEYITIAVCEIGACESAAVKITCTKGTLNLKTVIFS